VRAWISAVRRPRIQLGGVARNFVVVGSATAIGQGATILAAPVLARLYDPQAFGILSVYAALLSVLVAGSSLRYDLAVPLAGDPVEAVHLLVLSVIIALATSLALAVVVLLWGTSLSTALGAAPLAPFLWLLPIALFVASVAQAVASWAVYNRSFPAIGRMRAMQGFAQAFCQGALGLARVGPIGLIVGDVAGRLVGIEQLFRPLLTALSSITLTTGAMRRYTGQRWGFARVMTAASFLSAMSLQVPFLLIPALFDLESSGQYFVAYRVLVLPASLVAAALSQVFFGEASSRRGDARRLHDLARNTAVSLFVFSIPTYMMLLVAGPILLTAVFGSQWTNAGLYAQIMSPGLVLWSVSSPISTLLVVGRRERESLAFTAAELGLKAGALTSGALLHSLAAGLVLLSAVTALISIAALWRILRVASVRLQELVRPVGRIIALTLPSLAFVVLVSTIVPAAALAAAAAGWAIAFGLAAFCSPEPRALFSGSHD
jgi:lipopolysaccharide exporter